MSKKEGVLVIDIASIPNDFPSIDTWYSAIKRNNIIFYTLNQNKVAVANKPYVLKGDTDKILVDISTDEGKKIYNEIKERTSEWKQ